MATKSKRLRKAKGLKIIASLLVIVLSGAFAASFCKINDLSGDLGGGSIGSMLNQTQGDFTGSSMFQQELGKNLYYMNQMALVYHSEDAVRDGSALKEQEALLEQQKKKDLEERLEAAREGKAEEEENDQQYTLPYETAYETQEETVPTAPASSDSSTTTGPSGGASTKQAALTAEEEAAVKQSVEYEYNEKLRDLQIGFDENYRKAREGLQNLTNLHYILVNRETGLCYTNMGELTDPAATDLRSLVEQYRWNESYTEKYGYHAGERVETVSNNWIRPDTDTGFYNWIMPYSERMTLYEKTFVDKGWDIYIGLNDTITPGADNFLTIEGRFESAKMTLPVYVALGVVLPLLVLALIIYLAAACGYRAGTEEIVPLWTDRIPNDLHLLLSGALFAVGVAGAVFSMDQYWYSENPAQTLLLWAVAACGGAAGGVLLEWITSAARNVKRRQFWRNTLLAKGFRFIRRNWRRFQKALRNIMADIREHAVPKHKMENLRASILFLFVGYLLMNAILIALAISATQGYQPFAFLFFGAAAALFNIIVLISIWKSVIALDEIMTAVSKARQGDLSGSLQTAKMPRLLRKFGEDVVGMQDGLRAAVDEAIKGEHMKTELITNVSHDLKTPLTAIVNYVDLLKKCDISDETAQGYIGVLEEKSERLKHLIEDLVEASKATTGNIQLNFIQVNLYELAMQAVGESEDAMEAAGLDVRLSRPEREPVLHADSQKTWRIIDNLISNVKKYAMPGTRVYIDVGEENGYGFFSIKNISREPLDVPVEQLTQRFVRGDAARSTEGSGLGLSIAQSLCELQQGALEISLDGDLFKVTVRIPLEHTAG